MANKTLECIYSRVSCREYDEKKVSLKKLEAILEAGKMAPSAMNRQIASITCVRSKSNIEKLRALSLEEAKRDCMLTQSYWCTDLVKTALQCRTAHVSLKTFSWLQTRLKSNLAG